MVSWDSISMPNSKENNTFWIKMAAWFSKINLILIYLFIYFTFKLTLACIYKGCEFFHLIQQEEAILHTEPYIFNRGGQTDLSCSLGSLNISLSKFNFFGGGGHLLLFGYRLLLCRITSRELIHKHDFENLFIIVSQRTYDFLQLKRAVVSAIKTEEKWLCKNKLW